MMSDFNSVDFCAQNQISVARYDPGHNWCWFSVVCNKIVAVFRFHFEEEICWDFFKLLNCSILHPVTRANMTFVYGSSEKLPQIQKKGKIDHYKGPEFDWFEAFLKKSHGSDCQWGSWTNYHGIDFYELDEEHL